MVNLCWYFSSDWESALEVTLPIAIYADLIVS